METKILEVLRYFSRFDYAPTLDEILIFLAQKTNQNSLKKRVEILVENKKVLKNGKKYTLWEYSRISSRNNQKFLWSSRKKAKAAFFIKLASFFPQIRLIGFSGSLAMMNASKNDDIDIFLISKKNRLWTARLICLTIAAFLGKRRKFGEPHADDKICLNLLFDEMGLSIPRKKRSYFVAHEVLQMKPVVDKENTYKSFLEANNWVFKIFPNAPSSIPHFLTQLEPTRIREVQNRKKWVSSLGDLLERVLKKLQLYLINRHRTTELITDEQLWFFPDDFEKKMYNIKTV